MNKRGKDKANEDILKLISQSNNILLKIIDDFKKKFQ